MSWTGWTDDGRSEGGVHGGLHVPQDGYGSMANMLEAEETAEGFKYPHLQLRQSDLIYGFMEMDMLEKILLYT